MLGKQSIDFALGYCLKVPVTAAFWWSRVSLPLESGTSFLLIASCLKVHVPTNTCTVCSVSIALLGMRTQCYHRWSLAKVLFSFARRFLHIRRTWVSAFNNSAKLQTKLTNPLLPMFSLKLLYLQSIAVIVQSGWSLRFGFQSPLIVLFVKLYYHECRRLVRGVHVTSVK